MKTNAGTCLQTPLLLLVPYRRCHVSRYHAWMQSAELQQLTASEPLTLADEYAMQLSWRRDPDKCTFILLDRARHEQTGSEEESMIGDVNLFVLPSEEDGGDAAELEVMLAEKGARGAGRGRQAAAAMLRYGAEVLQLTRFQAKIGYDNAASRHLFSQHLGFSESSRSDVFREVTMEARVAPDWMARLERLSGEYRVLPWSDEGGDGGDVISCADRDTRDECARPDGSAAGGGTQG